jgi:hypothetical protein
MADSGHGLAEDAEAKLHISKESLERAAQSKEQLEKAMRERKAALAEKQVCRHCK